MNLYASNSLCHVALHKIYNQSSGNNSCLQKKMKVLIDAKNITNYIFFFYVLIRFFLFHLVRGCYSDLVCVLKWSCSAVSLHLDAAAV